MLVQDVSPEHRSRLQIHPIKFEAFDFPACELVWAGFALPFCSRAAWPALLERAIAALSLGGRIAGDVFGNDHAWSVEPDILTLSESQLRADLRRLTIEAFDIENGYRVCGTVTRWHASGFAARKEPSDA